MRDVPFQTGGPLPSNSPVYIERKADHEALRHLHQMHYLQLTEPRQQGKTSFVYRLRSKLSSSGYVFAYVDVEGLEHSNYTDWYTALTDRLTIQFEFVPELRRYFSDEYPLYTGGWRDCLAYLGRMGQQESKNIVIALDEIGSVPTEWAEAFFRVLREAYVVREVEPYFKHITFILAGAFDPRDLIADSKISPFNVAQRVHLEDFTLDQVKQLVAHLGLPASQASEVSERLIYWTDGQPYLVQKICSYLAESQDTVDASAVGTAVERFFYEDTNHLPRISKDLAADPELLRYTHRATTGDVKFSPAVNPVHFQLAHVIGVIKPDEHGYCRIRNRIYEQALAEIEVSSDHNLSEELQPQSQPQDEFHYDAFISYSHEDSAWVRDTLLLYLESECLRVCIDFRDFEPGAPILTEMERAVLQSRKTLLVLTSDYLASEWAEFENILASTLDPAARRRRVIPLLLKPCELPLRIRTLTYLDFTGAESEFELQRLVAAVRSEPKADQPPPASQPVSSKASDLRLLIADPSSGKRSDSRLEFSIPPSDSSRRPAPAWQIAFRVYLDNQGPSMARYIIVEMCVTSDTDSFWTYRYKSDPFLIEEEPRPWQITQSDTHIHCYFEGGADFICHDQVQQRLGLVKMLVPYGQADTTLTFQHRILAEGHKSQGSFAIALKPER